MSVPKVLLIANCDLAGRGIGSLFLRDVISHYPSGRMLCYAIAPSLYEAEETITCGCRTLNRYAPTSRWPGLAGYHHWRFAKCTSHRYSREIREIIHCERIDLVWAVLNGPAMIHLCHQLMSQIEVPFVCTEWDMPQCQALLLPFSLLPWTSLLEKHKWLFQTAIRVSAVSQAACRILRQEYGVEAIPWRHGIRKAKWVARKPMTDGKDNLAIAFAGSLYAKREWNALIRALDDAKWVIEGRAVRIHFIGRFPRFFAKRNRNVLQHGPQTFERTLELLASMDVAYLPYWLSPKWSYVVKTSFPGKLSAYVAVGLPVFYHGPGDSSVSEFLRDYPVGLECSSLESVDIQRSLKRFVHDQGFLNHAVLARQAALGHELGHHVMLARFAQLLGIDGHELKAVA